LSRKIPAEGGFFLILRLYPIGHREAEGSKEKSAQEELIF